VFVYPSYLIFIALSYFFFFFFSSRRRHTRSYGDWSSDVCSSDLCSRSSPLAERVGRLYGEEREQPSCRVSYEARPYLMFLALHRSEERRVGKECRSRWAQ